MMTSKHVRNFGFTRRFIVWVVVLLFSGLASQTLFAQSEPQTLEQLRTAIERHDYSNERRAGYAARACDEFNDGESCFKRATLANVYSPDLGDERLEYKYFSKACGKSFVAGCRRAGEMAAVGKGTKQNKIDAYNLYTIGCNEGDASACEDRNVISSETRRLLAEKSSSAKSSTQQDGVHGRGSMPRDNASFAEHRAALRQLSNLTSVGTQTCNDLIRRLTPDQGKSMGELGQRWWMLLQASYRSNNNACSVVPVAISRQVERPIATPAPRVSPASSGYTSCDSTCQRERTIRDNTSLRCYVKDGRRICNK